MKPIDHTIPLESGHLFARQWGSIHAASVPIVLIHESLGCVETWREWSELLHETTGHPVIAYDRLGFGRSSPYPDEIRADFVAAEATTSFPALLDALQIRQFIVFGHSVGGGMGVVMATEYPDRCVGLITESAQSFIEDVTIEGLKIGRDRFKLPTHMARLRKYHGDKADWVLRSWADTWLAPAAVKWSLYDIAPKVRCPLLAIHGELDDFASTKQPQMLCDRVGGASRLVLLPECRHIPHREQTERVLTEVQQFLSTL